MAAFLEQSLGMGRLEIVDTDLGAGNMGGDGQHRHPIAMGVEKTIDQMEISRAATAAADRQFPGEMRLGAGRESSAFLMAHMDPLDLLLESQRIGEPVQGVADDSIDALDARLGEGFGHIGCRGPTHHQLLWLYRSITRCSPSRAAYPPPNRTCRGESPVRCIRGR